MTTLTRGTGPRSFATEKPMKRTLVVCYSRDGSTRKIAQRITDTLGADLDIIEDVVPRAGAAGFVRSAFEALAKGLPTIRVQRDPKDYELVILGTPVWVGTLASPMRSYLNQFRGHFKDVACFCTMGGRGAESTLREMQVLCGIETALTYFTTERAVAAGDHDGEVSAFIARLGHRAAFDAARAA